MKVPESMDGAISKKFNDIVECVDVVPTLLEIIGIPIPPEVQGNILPVVNSKETYDGDGIGLTEYHGWKSMRFDGYRYVIEKDKEHLYDLSNDPLEYNDVSDNHDYVNVLSEARKMLLQRMIKIEQPLVREWPY